MNSFEVHFPGVYSQREKIALEKYYKMISDIENRGLVDVKALVNGSLPCDTPGIGPTLAVDEIMVMYNHDKYDPDNRLWHDEIYARSLGYDGIPVCMTYGAYDDAFMSAVDADGRDGLLVSQLNHSVVSHRPIYIGDTLFMVLDEKRIADITPQYGAQYHSFALLNRGSVYNQHGEKVSSVTYSCVENLAAFKDPSLKPENWFFWMAPDWESREDRYYTDDDWAFITETWKNEAPRGDDPLYWEDVSLGDEPNATLDGPIDDTPDPIPPFGMGLMGSRTLKREILDPEIKKYMVRNPYDGIYRFSSRKMSRPEFPESALAAMSAMHAGETPVQTDDDAMSPPPKRYILINFLGREYAIRHINNWMGYHGRLKSISWGIMPPEAMDNYGLCVPESPFANRFLDVLPDRKRTCLHHGLERDIALVKSRVFSKRIENGEYLVDLAWWIETIDGKTYEEGQAKVALPSRNVS